MKNDNSWTKGFSIELWQNLSGSAVSAYKNACGLIKDAATLFHAKRFDRSAVLAILAEEELSKSLFLIICRTQNRWDSAVYHSLKKHPEKQSMSIAMKAYFDWFIENYESVIMKNQFSFVPIKPAQIPSQEWINEWIAMVKKSIKKPKRERLKQSLLYVGLDENAKVINEPGGLAREEAEVIFNEAKKIKKIVEFALSSQIDGFNAM